MTNWKDIAAQLKRGREQYQKAMESVNRLVELAAELPEGEAERLLRREVTRRAELREVVPRQFICEYCKDTHKMTWHDDGEYETREVMCTRCPTPCNECGGKPLGPFCVKTPCDCKCHAHHFLYKTFRKKV